MRKKRKFRLRNILFILFAFYIVYTIGAQQIKLWDLAKQESELKVRLDECKSEKKDLEEKVRLLHTDSYIEKLARDELGLVKSDEIIYKERKD